MGSMKSYRRIVWSLLVLSIVGTVVYSYFLIENNVPDQLTLFIDETENFDFAFPVTGEINNDSGEESNVSVFQSTNKPVDGAIRFDFGEPFSIKADALGNYKMLVKLFGFIQLKEMNLHVVEPVKVIPVGKTIGIYVETDGVMVLGTGAVTGKDGINYEPAENAIYSGDYILAVNGTNVETIGELSSQIQEGKGQKATLRIRRKGEEQEVVVSPIEAVDGSYKLGIWTRQDTQGIGTLTFVDENGKFGALGHGITDSDTGILMEIEGGSIYEARIIDIVKGEQGEPGEMMGMIQVSSNTRLGSIESNQEQGIFGMISGNMNTYNNLSEDIDHANGRNREKGTALEIGLKQEIEIGKAKILCDLGEGVQPFDIEIEKIQMNSSDVNKSMVIRITDEALLEKTNGIVQGMSGSPIIQNGKLIGAVTHVFVQNPAKGYGIFIENMME